jgi:hypothetical protein
MVILLMPTIEFLTEKNCFKVQNHRFFDGKMVLPRPNNSYKKQHQTNGGLSSTCMHVTTDRQETAGDRAIRAVGL